MPLKIVLLISILGLISIMAGEDPEPTTAAETQPRSVFELSLDELVSVVVSGSKRPELSTQAPASITSFSRAKMDQMGAYRIADLADRAAGYSSFSIYGERVLETRGHKAGSFNNNKHLLLIDGIPVNHAKGYKVSTESELPLFFADQVEFLRGPASSLYGVSAFSGVVNIRSRSLESDGWAMESNVGRGDYDDNTRAWFNLLKRDDRGDTKLFVGYFDKSASRDFVGVRDDPDNLYWDDQKSLFLNASYRSRSGPLAGVTAGLIYMEKRGGLGEHWMHGQWSSQLNDLTWETMVPYLKYDRELKRNLKLVSYLKINRSRETGFIATQPPQTNENNTGEGSPFFSYDQLVENTEILGELHWDIRERGNLIFGVNYDTRFQAGEPETFSASISADPGDPILFDTNNMIDSPTFDTWSGYVQYQNQFDLLAGATLTLGARMDNGSVRDDSYEQLSPRLAWVQKVSQSFTLKLLYGTALRAPGIKEVGLNRESILTLLERGQSAEGIRPLTAETFESLEVSAGWSRQGFNGSVTLYENKITDSLDGVRFGDLNIFANSQGETEARGVELEMETRFSEDWGVFANWSQSKAEDAAGRESAIDVPTRYGNLILFYGHSDRPGLAGALMWRHMGEFRTGSAELSRPPGWERVDLNLDYGRGRMRYGLTVGNLFDDHAKYPKDGLEDVPLPSRHVTFSVRSRF